MIIEAVESKVDFPPYKHIQVSGAQFCCDRMREKWLTPDITFGNTLFCTVNSLAKVRMQPAYCHPLGVVGLEIDNCPYCGARIEVNVEARVDAQDP